VTIKSRCNVANGLPVTMSPLFEAPANAVTAPSNRGQHRERQRCWMQTSETVNATGGVKPIVMSGARVWPLMCRCCGAWVWAGAWARTRGRRGLSAAGERESAKARNRGDEGRAGRNMARYGAFGLRFSSPVKGSQRNSHGRPWPLPKILRLCGNRRIESVQLHIAAIASRLWRNAKRKPPFRGGISNQAAS
jgi:hypothetical protein